MLSLIAGALVLAHLLLACDAGADLRPVQVGERIALTAAESPDLLLVARSEATHGWALVKVNIDSGRRSVSAITDADRDMPPILSRDGSTVHYAASTVFGSRLMRLSVESGARTA